MCTNPSDELRKGIEQIADLYRSSTYNRILDKRHHVPFMNAIGKAMDETSHTRFLAWMFNSSVYAKTAAPHCWHLFVCLHQSVKGLRWRLLFEIRF